MSHELYIRALSAMFLFWNGARILTYLPTIGKLLAREADMRSHSLLSWGCWALSNGTFALVLLEMSRGIPNGMFWVNLANTLMCVIVSLIILFRRFPRLHTSVSKVYRNIRRNEWKPDALSGQPALLHLGGRSLAGGAISVDPVATIAPTRLGRLALWVALASVVAFGTAGAVTYDLWPGHDQSAGVESNASSARGTAVGRAEIIRRVPSPPFDHGGAQPRNFPAPSVATVWPGSGDDFAKQNRRRSVQQVPVDEVRAGVVVEAAPVVYAAPPGVYEGPPLVYAQAPVAYGRGYEGEYWDRRQWHDNGRHKGWKHRQHDDADDE